MGPGFNVVGAVERFGGVEDQLFGLVHRLTQTVGEAAIGIGNIGAFLQKKNFCLLVQSSQPGRRAGTARIAANNDILHGFTLLFLVR